MRVIPALVLLAYFWYRNLRTVQDLEQRVVELERERDTAKDAGR